MKTSINYSIGRLYYLGQLAYNTKTRVCDHVWQRLKDLDIRRPPRGTRAGKHSIRPIQTIVSQNGHCVCKHSVGANHNNLVQIKPITKPWNVAHCRTPVHLKACCMNVQSARNKTTSICEYIKDNDLDIVALTETWLQGDRDLALCDIITPVGYKIITIPRPASKPGGGLAVIHRANINVEARRLNYTTFESMECNIKIASSQTKLLVLYRPPPSKRNNLKVSEFFEEWSAALGTTNLTSDKVILTGDMNFHIDKPSDPTTKKFLTSLQDIGLKQYVDVPTHRC